MTVKFLKKLALPLLCGALLVLAAGCGKATREITIVDSGNQTLVTASNGDTVAEILEEAEISLSDEDTVSPAADEVLDDSIDTITISRHADVTVTDGENVTEVSLTGGTVSDAIEIAGITLNDNDVVNYSLSAYLTDGMEITVERWYEVTLTVAGTSQTVVTNAATVADLLEEQNVIVDEDDSVTPDVTESLSEGLEITVVYSSTAQIIETEEIAYSTIEQESDSLYIGETSVAQAGQNGERTNVYEVTYVEGEETDRTLVDSYISVEAVDEIILIGTKEETTTTTQKATTTTQQATTKQTEQTTTASSGQPTPESIPDGVSYWTFSEDCDGSGNGWFTFYFEDGHVEYEDYWAS